MHKRCFYILLCFVFTGPVFAQKVKWDSTARPAVYKAQVGVYQSYKRSSDDIVFIGASLTHWTDWNELLNMNTIKNRGIPGDITFGVLERIEEALKGNPKKIFIQIGLNDLTKNIPDEVILNNYSRMIKSIRVISPKTKIYFQTMLPINNEFKSSLKANLNEKVTAINAALKTLTAKENVTLIDLHSAFLDKTGKLQASLTYDGVHLTAEGYQLWASVLIKGRYLENK